MEHRIEYRPVEGFPGYRVGNDGTVWSCWKLGGKSELGDEWREVKQQIHTNGYRLVNLTAEGKKSKRYVHRLVLAAFIGPCPERMEACHNNGIRHDNRIGNLRWDTRSANMEDKRKHGTMAIGEKCSWSKLTEAKIAEARILYATGDWTFEQLGQRYGVTEIPVALALRGKTWKHLTGQKPNETPLACCQ